VGYSLHHSVSDQSVPDGIREVVASNNEFKCRIRPR
jgi:hypothetical protein